MVDASPDKFDTLADHVSKVFGINNRLLLLRMRMNLTQKEFANALGLKYRTYIAYELGEQVPKLATLTALSKMGVDMNWLVTGIEPDQHAEASAVEPVVRAIDQALLGRIIDGVIKTYAELGARLPPINQGEVVGRIYDLVYGIADDAERRGALRYALNELRAELAKIPSDTASRKQQA